MSLKTKRFFISSMLLLCLHVLPAWVKAQDSTVVKQKAFVSMKYLNDDGEKRVNFRAYTRKDRKKIPAQSSIVNLYLNENSEFGMLGSITTDENGEGSVLLDEKFKALTDTLSSYNFLGSLVNDPRLMEVEKEITIRCAKLDMSLYEEDSLHYVQVTAAEKGDSGLWQPIPDLEIGIFVQRYFSLLPVTEYPLYTDEDGEAIFEFPQDLKGDSLGKLTLSATVDAHEDYGTIVVTGQRQWGVPVIHQDGDERLLSSSRENAPLFLVVVSNVIILGLWGFIGFIILQLFKIKSHGKSKKIQHENIN